MSLRLKTPITIVSLTAALAICGVGRIVRAGAQQIISSRTLLAMVTDTGNRSLVELEPDDFVVDQGGQPREVLSLHIADYPLVVLLDNSSAATGDLDAIRSAAGRFISRLGDRSVAVGTLTDPAHLVASFDDGRAAVLDRARRVAADGAPARPLEAIANAVHALQDTGTPFGGVIVVSARAVDPPDASERDTMSTTLASGVLVSSVANRGTGTSTAAQPDDLLRALAEETRAAYTPIYSAASYQIALDRLADRLATEMMIEFLVPPEAAAAGDVRVGVRTPGARATVLRLR